MNRANHYFNREFVGVREALQNLPDVLDAAESGNFVVYITRREKPVAAIVSLDVVDGVVGVRGSDGPGIPGAVDAAVRLVETLLAQDEGVDLVSAFETDVNELVGGCMSLADLLLSRFPFRELRLKDKDKKRKPKKAGESPEGMASEIVIHRLCNRPDLKSIVRAKIPLVAGSLLAGQLQGLVTQSNTGSAFLLQFLRTRVRSGFSLYLRCPR